MRSFLNIKTPIDRMIPLLPLFCIYAAFFCLNALAQNASDTGKSATDTGNGETHIAGTVRGNVVNLRLGPTTQSAIIGKLKRGAKVSVTGEDGEWYSVKPQYGRAGWVHRDLLDIEQITPEPVKIEVEGKTQGGVREIISIRTETISEEEEKVVFVLSDFFTPETFVVAGENPKVICDFSNALLGEGVKRLIPVDGRLIREVRIEPRTGTESVVRITMSLVPDKNYQVKQIFHRQDKLYVLIVKPTK